MLNKSFQAQFLIPMAISVAFGLLFVTVIILVLLPIYLLWINPLHRSWVWVKRGDWLSREGAEPAVREERDFSQPATSEGATLASTLPWLLTGALTLAGATTSVQAQELTRAQAVELALERNYGIRIAQTNADLADVGNAWGAAGALPSLGLNANAGGNVNDQTQNPSTFLPIATQSTSVSPGVQMQWRLFDGWGMFATKDRLALLAEQAHGNAGLVVESTVQAVLTAYDNVLVQEESAKVLRSALDLTRARLARLKRSVDLGAAGTFDQLQFDNALLNDSTALLRQEVAVRAARRNLNLLMVQDEEVVWTLTSPLAMPTGGLNLDALTDQLTTSNQSIQNAVLSKQLAETGLRQAKARLYPVVGLTANWGNTVGASGTRSELPPDLFFNPYEDGDISSNVTNYGAALTLNFNLFNGGATKRAMEQAQIQVDLAMLDHDRLVSEARAALESAWDRRETAASIHGMAVQRVSNAKRSAEIGSGRYRDGVLNAMDFRALDVALMQAEAAELAARQEWAAAHWEVLRLAGGLRGGWRSE